MKTRFSIKKAISALLCVTLVVSALYIGTKPTAVSASDETNNETTTTIKEEVLAFHDYEDAKTTFNNDDIWTYRGSSRPATDPNNASNTVLKHITGYQDYGIIALGDDYKEKAPTKYVEAEEGATYKITFKWKYEYETRSDGKANGKTTIYAGLSKTIDGNGTGSVAARYLNTTNGIQQEVTNFIKGESDADWNEENVYYTIDETRSEALINHPYLVLYTNTPSKGIVYFDDIKVTTLKKTTETVLAENDYQTAAAIDTTHESSDIGTAVENWVWTGRKHSGALIPTYDPTDDAKQNIVLRHRACVGDLSVIRLADAYADATATDGIEVATGTTYKVSFKWMTEGVAKEGPEFGVALAKKPGEATGGPIETDGQGTYIVENDTQHDISNTYVVKKITTGTAGDETWREATVYFTVTEEMAIDTYPQLVIYANRGGQYGSYSTSGYGLSIYFDNIKVTTVDKVEYLDYKEYEDQSLAENDYANAKMNLYDSAIYKYRGASRPVKDPDDETNIVLASITGYTDRGLIVLGDDYSEIEPQTYIKAEAGTTYKISFKWKYKGFQSGSSTKVYIGLSQKCDITKGPSNITSDICREEIPGAEVFGERNDTSWNEETIYVTVNETWSAALEEYPYLVLYTQNGGIAGVMYFDDIEVSIPAAATVKYNYGSKSHSEYYADGDIKDYQPLESEGVTVTWYTDEACTKAYEFVDYTEYKEMTLYGKGSYQAGDMDGDGTVVEKDITSLRDVLAGAAAQETTANAAKANAVVDYDVNGDNAEDVKDLVHAARLVRLPDGIGITSVTLSLYEEEGDTYQYGVAWQSAVQLQTPVVEVIPANETWETATITRIIGSAEDSTAHSTYKIKDSYDYTTIGNTKYDGDSWYLNKGLIATHDVVTVYSNKLVISGLTAGQAYKYRVGDAALKEYSTEGTFTAYNSKQGSEDDTAFDFIFMTDSQQTSDKETSKVVWGRTLWTAMKNMPNAEFLALGGDLVNYNSIEQQWTELLDANKKYMMSIPTMPTAGNHEWNMVSGGSINSAYDFNSHFNLSYQESAGTTADSLKNGYSGTYYSYDYKGVHFVVLNTNEVYTNHTENGTYTLGEEQMTWLESDLAAAKEAEDAGTINYTIVYMHHGLYTVGAAGIGKDSHETKDLRTQLQGIFAENGVDLVLNGHDHIYSVTKVLDKNGAIVADDSTTGGVVYMTGAIAGTTSPSKSNFGTSDGKGGTYNGVDTNVQTAYAKIISNEDCYPDSTTKIALSNCWTELSVNENAITVTTYTVDKQAARQLDTFTIKKNNVGTTFGTVSE